MAKIIVLDESFTRDNTGIRAINAKDTIGVRLTIDGIRGWYFVEFYLRGSYTGEKVEVTWTWPGASNTAEQAFDNKRLRAFGSYEGLLAQLLQKASEQGLDKPEVIAGWAAKTQIN